MLNIATAHANMISLFIIRFLDSITNVSESNITGTFPYKSYPRFAPYI